MDQNHLNEALRSLKTAADELFETMRVRRIHDLDLLNRDLSNTCEDFVLIAATVCGTPFGGIRLLDESMQYLKARYGDLELPEIAPRADSFCDICIQTTDDLLVIPDTRLDERVRNTEWVTANKIRFYAGAPLVTDDGLPLGTICVVDDKKVHHLEEVQIVTLKALARLVMQSLTTMLHIPRISSPVPSV